PSSAALTTPTCASSATRACSSSPTRPTRIWRWGFGVRNRPVPNPEPPAPNSETHVLNPAFRLRILRPRPARRDHGRRALRPARRLRRPAPHELHRPRPLAFDLWRRGRQLRPELELLPRRR